MGSESSKWNSNSNSSSSNENEKIEEMICLQEEIENIEIKIAWIVKKSINLNDGHVNVLGYKKKNKINFTKGKKNVFEIKNGIKCSFKHWALILELSNGSFVNI